MRRIKVLVNKLVSFEILIRPPKARALVLRPKASISKCFSRTVKDRSYIQAYVSSEFKNHSSTRWLTVLWSFSPFLHLQFNSFLRWSQGSPKANILSRWSLTAVIFSCYFCVSSLGRVKHRILKISRWAAHSPVRRLTLYRNRWWSAQTQLDTGLSTRSSSACEPLLFLPPIFAILKYLPSDIPRKGQSLFINAVTIRQVEAGLFVYKFSL